MGCISRTGCISLVPARSSLTGRFVGLWLNADMTVGSLNVRFRGVSSTNRRNTF